MSTRLHHRVKHLERRRGAKLSCCGVCGRPLNGRPSNSTDLRMQCIIPTDDEPEPDLGPERCPGCGAMRVLRLTFDERASSPAPADLV